MKLDFCLYHIPNISKDHFYVYNFFLVEINNALKISDKTVLIFFFTVFYNFASTSLPTIPSTTLPTSLSTHLSAFQHVYVVSTRPSTLSIHNFNLTVCLLHVIVRLPSTVLPSLTFQLFNTYIFHLHICQHYLSIHNSNLSVCLCCSSSFVSPAPYFPPFRPSSISSAGTQ